MSLLTLLRTPRGGTTVIKEWTGSGVATAAGAATWSRAKAYAASGTVAAAGSASRSRVRNHTASGGAVTSGTALVVRVQAWVATGTVVAASTASKSRLRNPLVMGGASTGGEASTQKVNGVVVHTYVASGQATFTGTTTHHRYLSKVKRTGNIATLDVSTNTGSQSVEVPSDAKLALVFVGGISPTANYFSTGAVTLGGSSMSVAKAKDATANALQGCLFWLNTPSVGSQTLAWDWAGASNGNVSVPPMATVVFLKGTATSDPVRSVG